MTKPIISVEHLSNAYRIGLKEDIPDTFVAAMTGWLQAPLRNWKRLRRLNTFDESPVATQAAESQRSEVSGANVPANGDGCDPPPSTIHHQPPSDTLWALRDVSFDVHEGEVVGIIGRNGAGKSTLLKILSRITEPTHGRAVIRGRVSSLLEVGTGFHPELTGRENIYMNGTILGMRKREIDRKFDEIVEFSGVEKFLDTPSKRYSSGMQVRLAFAVAAHLEPEILIIDEVLAVGDAEFQKKCLGKMQDVAKGGRTVLFVSHNMAAISQLCNRAIRIAAGGIVADDSAANVITQYLTSPLPFQGECCWPDDASAPGDCRTRLLSASLNQNDSQISVMDINKPCHIEIRFRILQRVRNLVTGVSFYDAVGTCLFAHCDWRENKLDPGIYKKNVEIPSHVFAEGQISVLVQLVFYDPDIKSVVLPEAFSFTAIDSADSCAVRGKYKGPWPGLLRLGLKWGNAEHAS